MALTLSDKSKGKSSGGLVMTYRLAREFSSPPSPSAPPPALAPSQTDTGQYRGYRTSGGTWRTGLSRAKNQSREQEQEQYDNKNKSSEKEQEHEQTWPKRSE